MNSKDKINLKIHKIKTNFCILFLINKLKNNPILKPKRRIIKEIK